jgi:hypothetical protein
MHHLASRLKKLEARLRLAPLGRVFIIGRGDPQPPDLHVRDLVVVLAHTAPEEGAPQGGELNCFRSSHSELVC